MPKLEKIGVIEPPEQPTVGTKRMNYFIISSLVVIALGIGVIFSWAFANDDILEIKNDPMPVRVVNDEDSHVSGVAVMTADFCKNVSVEGSLRTSFVSKTREVFLPLNKERSQEGCQKVDLPVLIPKELPSDTYQIRLRATYDLNPLKQGIVEEFMSQEFKVQSSDRS